MLSHMMDRSQSVLVLNILWLLLLSQEASTSSLKQETPGFICVTLDWWPPEKCNYEMCPWHSSGAYHINLTELEPYAKPLDRFVLRIGGSLQDHVLFVESDHDCPFSTQFPKDPSEHLLEFGWGCVTRSRLTEISDFCKNVGCQIIWGINAMNGRHQNGTGLWNSTNANELLFAFRSMDAPLYAVTLGNEVWGEMVGLSEDQAVRSFVELNTILKTIWPDETQRPLLGGFDGYVTRKQFPFINNVLDRLAEHDVTLDAITYHNYPLGSSNDENVIHHVMIPNFGSVKELGTSMTELSRNASIPQTWMSECGGSSNSGSPEATGSYASGFWYLDNMAMLHKMGHQQFCRQTLAGGNYGLLDQLEPRTVHPDYWSAVLYQKLLEAPEQEPLEVFGTPRCDSDGKEDDEDFGANWYVYSSKKSPSTLAMLGINFSPTKTCHLDLTKNPFDVTVYSLTPDSESFQAPWKSQTSWLNGRPLRVVDGKLPELTGDTQDGLRNLILKPWTYSFFEISYRPADPNNSTRTE